MTKKIKPVNVDDFDIEQLACYILGIDEDSSTSDIDDALYDKFECTLESFQQIIRCLLPLCDVGQSPLTNKVYRGFSDRNNSCWIVKCE